MAKRLLDLLCAAIGLAVALPVVAVAALGIRLSSAGPAIYRTRRAGIGGRPFTMYKLRTMRLDHGITRSRITLPDDPRVFRLGAFLRRSKIDELPQLVNVLRGEMSIVGPRPEDPHFVARHYAPVHHETLRVRPGLASPGSLYHDTHGDAYLAGGDPEARYIERLLPVKLALDVVYVRHASVRYDLVIIWRVIATIGGKLAGRRRFPDPPEMAVARTLAARAADDAMVLATAGECA
jgi:lipopolysaccharide/colanic/teichoic acid biosynthesis glycosyltransferase